MTRKYRRKLRQIKTTLTLTDGSVHEIEFQSDVSPEEFATILKMYLEEITR
jgi:hypothetical protein